MAYYIEVRPGPAFAALDRSTGDIMSIRSESTEPEDRAADLEAGHRLAAQYSTGWVLNLRRLLAAVQAEGATLSEPARRALDEALDGLQIALPGPVAGGRVPASDLQGQRPHVMLDRSPRTLLVGSTPDRLEALLLGLGVGEVPPAVTFARSADQAHRLLHRDPFDLVIYDYAAPDLAGLTAVSELVALPVCPPIILVAGDGNEALAAAAFKAGVYDYLPERGLTPQALSRSIVQTLHRRHLEGELEAAHRRLAELVNRDPLTGLHNRRYFENRLTIEFARAHRFGEPLALILLDIDHFKGINDRFGHPTGDLVLIEVGNRLSALLRQIDLVARIGGEEFALVLPNTGLAGARALAERVVESIRAHPMDYGGSDLRITVSGGVAALPECAAATRVDLFACADQALYRAKEEGRDRIAS